MSIDRTMYDDVKARRLEAWRKMKQCQKDKHPRREAYFRDLYEQYTRALMEIREV